MAEEYIEREAVCYQLAKQATIDGQPRAIRRAAKIVADFPAADVVPVRHGRWVEVEVKELAYYKMMIASMRCDQCGRYHNEVYHYGNPTEMVKYCGFCGVRMDGDGE